MSDHVIKLPDVGEGITEAEIVEWHVAVGDQVAEDDLLGAVMTDKAAVDIPTPVAGIISVLGGELGDVLAVGSDYVRIETSADSSGESSGESKDTRAEVAKPAATPETTKTDGDSAPVQDSAPAPVSAPVSAPVPEKVVSPDSPSTAAAQANTSVGSGKALASPSVRRRAFEHGVALRYVRGSGPAGRISHQDLDQFLASQQGAGSQAPLQSGDTVEEIKVVGMRRQIAERMQIAKRRIPHFSYVEETDVTSLEELRGQLNAKRKEDQPKLTLLPFMVLALVRAIEEFPQMNARFDDEAQIIRRHTAVHLGIAAQTDRGLMVPVVHNAQTLDIWAVARKITDLADAARSGRIKRDDLTGATITLTSLGALGGIVTTPVINYPEVAIVGINRIATRPVYVEDQVVPRKMMNLSSSFDHRVVDGFEAAEFVQRIRSYIEYPSTIFIPG